MNQIKIHHIALSCPDEEKAEIFFGKVLSLKKEKEFTLFADLAEQIFGINREIKVEVYSNNQVSFEIFITSEKLKITYEHICLTVPSKKELISRCKAHGVETTKVKRNEKEILFLKDFSGYLYEIKE
jgi:catechol 2,3-dioxygenase-like lactoylglutathione lyase family enzyme